MLAILEPMTGGITNSMAHVSFPVQSPSIQCFSTEKADSNVSIVSSIASEEPNTAKLNVFAAKEEKDGGESVSALVFAIDIKISCLYEWKTCIQVRKTSFFPV